jgi:peptidyl-prolyl cis-trans isomerase B (cyclophilin B)
VATNQMRREAAKRKLERQQERRAQQAARRKKVAVITAAAVAVLVVAGVVALTVSRGADAPAEPTAAAPTNAVTPSSIPTAIAPLPTRPSPLSATVSCDYPAATDGPAAKPNQPPPTTDVSTRGTVPVTLDTSAGSIPLTLDRALAPCTVNSFISLAQQGYFNDTPCHRLTTDPGLQVLQCGDPGGTGAGGPGYTIPDEVFPELTYGRGVLAMAKTAAPNSGGSQFFMVYGDGQLPPEYTAFGSITPEGLTVLDGIARKGHDGSFDAQAGGGKPVEPVTIEAVRVG